MDKIAGKEPTINVFQMVITGFSLSLDSNCDAEDMSESEMLNLFQSESGSEWEPPSQFSDKSEQQVRNPK